MHPRSGFAVLAICALAASANAPAEEPDSPPMIELPDEVRRDQLKADRACEHGRDQRAFSLYREELAPRGDKYAQYMVGRMYLEGEGVDEDRPRGAAWLALAAERSHARLETVHAKVVARLSADERAEAERIEGELLATYGDCVRLEAAHQSDDSTYREMTGSRVGASRMGALTVMGPYGNPRQNQFVVARRLLAQMTARIDYLQAHCAAVDEPAAR